ncbi:hypothetical protein [uncultured Croceitalea sp.]|uniref:hypothetical protein n=1 Tax=uncultured Croceitalea sp. TaxID=1798908 RepID=UPI0033059020
MRIALIEISESHEECIYSQVKFLNDAGIAVDLILNKRLEQQIDNYKHLCNSVYFVTPVKKNAFKKLKQQIQLLNTLKIYDLLVFNTASSSKMVRNLTFLLLFSRVKCFGILHNGRKLTSSFTQKIISLKIRHYFVLSDTIVKNIGSKSDVFISSFYPIFFPKFKLSIVKAEGEIWITIPGRIDWLRRDYDVLIKALAKVKNLNSIKILFLGKFDKNSDHGKQLWALIKAHKLERFFITFNSFVSNEDYQNLLMATDYIMPLLKSDENYLKYKVSGSFNLAYAHHKILLCKTYFEPLEDLSENGIFYDEDDLSNMLQKINNKSIATPKGYLDPKWSFTYQQDCYLSFLGC